MFDLSFSCYFGGSDGDGVAAGALAVLLSGLACLAAIGT